MPKAMIYAANWKMNLPFTQAVAFVQQNYIELAQCAEHNNIILCPAAPVIHTLSSMLKDTNVALAGQNCSAHKAGAFTGQIAATDLAAAGTTYCIVGHSECRRDSNESSTLVADKAGKVLDAGMTPIICVGETADEFKNNKTIATLDAQLDPLLSLLATNQKPILIAYEPVWAIGTGNVPTEKILAQCFSYLAQKTIHLNSHIALLYGGSVTSKNVSLLKQIPFLGGFLIGGASLDFQEFKKIVEC